MTIEADLFAAFNGLVSGRMHPLTFPQPAGAGAPTWPAIRYTFVDHARAPSICGDGGDATADPLVQFDLVHTTHAGMRALRTAFLTALESFALPAFVQGEGEEFDADTKTFRARVDVSISRSSTA